MRYLQTFFFSYSETSVIIFIQIGAFRTTETRFTFLRNSRLRNIENFSCCPLLETGMNQTVFRITKNSYLKQAKPLKFTQPRFHLNRNFTIGHRVFLTASSCLKSLISHLLHSPVLLYRKL